MAVNNNLKPLLLPSNIASVRHIRQCIRDLELVSEQLITETIRLKSGVTQRAERVPVSLLVEQLVLANKLQLGNKADVQDLKQRLSDQIDWAPRLQFTFANEPNDELLGRLVDWTRQNINLYTLIDIAISPYISGGFIVATPTHRYDFSWRNLFERKGSHFAELLANIQVEANG